MRDFVFRQRSNPNLPEELILEIPSGKCPWNHLVILPNKVLFFTDFGPEGVVGEMALSEPILKG